MAKVYHGRTEAEKNFIKTFDEICYRNNPWTVWRDFVNMFATSLSNAVDREEKRWKPREESYLAAINSYAKEERALFPKLSAFTVEALQKNPAQDFLGNLYMNLDFGSGWHGQFFTPWHVAEMMAKMQITAATYADLASKGYVSVNDPACGAGCMLMAFAKACMDDLNVGNYQPRVLFTGQDLDRVVAQMCYIQLSLLGCAGYVVVGNTLTQPMCGDVLFPAVQPECEIWYTPMWFSDVWQMRRAAHYLRNMLRKFTEENPE